MFGITR